MLGRREFQNTNRRLANITGGGSGRVFLQPHREILEWNFKLGHDRFPPQPFKFKIDWSLHHETLSEEVDASLKKSYNISETVSTNKTTLFLLLLLIRARSQGLSPPDVSTSYATREIRAARGGTLMGEKE
jgi:hypothetical protein